MVCARKESRGEIDDDGGRRAFVCYHTLKRRGQQVRACGRGAVSRNQAVALKHALSLGICSRRPTNAEPRDRVKEENVAVTGRRQFRGQHAEERGCRDDARSHLLGLQVFNISGEHELALEGEEPQ